MKHYFINNNPSSSSRTIITPPPPQIESKMNSPLTKHLGVGLYYHAYISPHIPLLTKPLPIDKSNPQSPTFDSLVPRGYDWRVAYLLAESLHVWHGWRTSLRPQITQ